jgi:hypothetical protein
MSPTDLETFGGYIDSVDFVEVVRSGGAAKKAETVPLDESKPQASIVDSNVVTFPEGTSVTVRNAVANWMLLAQLAASKAVRDKDAVREWMEAYISVLTKSGWAVEGNVGNETRESLFGSQMYQKIMTLVAVALGPIPTALAMVTAALTSLQSMDQHSPWITLFDRRGKSATSVGFQIANCESDSVGTVTLRGTEFVVEAHESLTQVLFFRFNKQEACVYERVRTLTLSADVLEKLSPKVSDRVLDMISDNILSFDL